MTAAIAIVGIAATLAAAFGGAYYGGRLQRSNNAEALALQLQIDNAAKFVAAVGDFTVGYAQSNKPGVENLTPTQRDEPVYLGYITLKSQTAAVEIVGPDELAELAVQILEKALDAGFDHGNRGVAAHVEVRDLTNEFRDEARKLRPVVRQKNGRRRQSGGEQPGPRY